MDKLEEDWNALQSMVFENLLGNSFSKFILLFVVSNGWYNVWET